MKKYLTADRAYEIASKWQENEVNDYVEKIIEKVEHRANQGYFTIRVGYPKDDNVNRDTCQKAFEDLGYKVIRDTYAWEISWKK